MFNYLNNISLNLKNHVKLSLLVTIVSFTVFQISSSIIGYINHSSTEIVAIDISTDSENKESIEVTQNDEMLTNQKTKNAFQSKFSTIEKSLFHYIPYYTPIDNPPPEA